ncbi:MAG: TonB family protein [Verrucomicrobiota bacterium]|nr:TonB family protein [Verrucomicrobiota bacterium]
MEEINMTAALLYKPVERWRIGSAFLAAIFVHIAAVALATRVSLPPSRPLVDDWAPVVAIEPAPEASTAESREEIPPAPLPPIDQPEFIQTEATPAPVHVMKREPQPLVRPFVNSSIVSRTTGARTQALSAPRPEYPYEARRQRLTGSGLAILTIDPQSGAVLDVAMARSTGSALLDNAAMSGFRRWRFKPGSAARVETPITFTLTGASY